MIISRSSHYAVTGIFHSFLWVTSIVCISHIVFIQSSVGHSGCCHVLAIVNNAAMTIGVHVQFSCSGVSDFATPWTAVRQVFLSITNSQGLHSLMSIESVMPSNRLILCPLLPLLPSIISSIRVFSNSHFSASGGQSIGVSASASTFCISLSNKYSGLISFKMDWLDLLAVQGTLKSLLQHHDNIFSKKCLIIEIYFDMYYST